MPRNPYIKFEPEAIDAQQQDTRFHPRYEHHPGIPGAGDVWREARLAAKRGDKSKLRKLTRKIREGRIDQFGQPKAA